MKEIIVWAIHAPAGTLALVTAVVAMCAKKGSTLHRKAGSCFTASMMVMLVSGIAAAYLKDSIDDMMLGAIVLYTSFTAWFAVHHKKNETGVLEEPALVWVVGFAITAFSISTGWREADVPPLAYVIWGRLLARSPAASVAPFALIAPCTGLVASAIAFAESYQPIQYAGMALILAGLAVIVLPARWAAMAGFKGG